MLTLKRFFAYSVAFHTLFIIAALLLVPAGKRLKQEEFFARLVSPEEFLSQAPIITSLPEVKPIVPAKPKSSMHSPLSEKNVHEKPGKELSASRNYSESVHTGQSAGKQEIEEKMQRPGVEGSPAGEGKPEIKENIRERIFDRNIIGDIAKRETEKEKKERTFTFDVKEMKYLGYLQRLKERIESIWMYPPYAASRGIFGDLVIRFTIKKNGRLGEVELMRTSGFKSLDDAALRALSDAEPFWPLPDEWGMETYTIVGHFIYTIYGYYVR